MAQGTFTTVINCMDGRTQLPVNEYLKKKYNVDYVDTITEPGPIKILAENDPSGLINSIKVRLDISVNKHGSKAIAMVGHHDCAGNPVARLEQIKQMNRAAEIINSWGFDVEVLKLYVNESWEVELID